MILCTNCGNQEADGVKFCTSCGTVLAVVAPTPPEPPAQHTVQPPPQQRPIQQQPAHQQSQQSTYQQAVPQPAVAPVSGTSSTVYKEEPISTGGYVGIMFLLAIPLLNLLLLIIWACGGCRTQNKRNLSRAILIWMLIGIILSGLVLLIGGFFFGDYLNTIKGILTI